MNADLLSIHACLGRHSKNFSIAALAHGDVPEKIRAAIGDTTGDRQWRSSPLSRRAVFWLLISMALHRMQSIPGAFARLMSDCRGRHLGLPLRPVSDGALAHARGRLGVEPFKVFFERMAALIKPTPSFHGLAVWAIDGMRIDLADRPSNEEKFGRPPGSKRSGYTQLHLVTLCCTLSHMIRAAGWCRVPPNERGVADDLIKQLGSGDLVLMDRGLFAGWLVAAIGDRGADYLVRIASNVRPAILRRRSKGDYDVMIRVHARKGFTASTRAIKARMITYKVNGESYTLVTSLTDPAITKRELIDLYCERWEIEISNSEFKCQLAVPPPGRAPTHFRGRSPEMVLQELWATLATYNLVRKMIGVAADRAGIPPRHISFTDAVEVIRNSSASIADASVEQIPHLYLRLLEDLADCARARPRRPRTAPRCKKRRKDRYVPKQDHHRSQYRPPAHIEWRDAV